jgi:hypothetical protein
LNSWFDFDGDGTLDVYSITAIAGPGGYTPPGLPVTSAADILLSEVGVYTLTFNVPGTVTDKLTTSLYSRFRYAAQPQATGDIRRRDLAAGGEVEDYVLLSLGDLVWLDDGAGGGVANDGVLNGSEAGIENVILRLLDGDGNAVLDGAGNEITTTTDADGRYRFTGLTPGDYRVEVVSDNFSAGGPLAGLPVIG